MLIYTVICYAYTGVAGKNYEHLKALHTRYSARGFAILAFPCNQFLRQEPGSNEDIKRTVVQRYGEDFADMFSKVKVNGAKAHPLYKWLKSKLRISLISAIEWNFAKFLIDRSGQPVKRYSPTKDPKDMEDDIVRCLDAEVGLTTSQ